MRQSALDKKKILAVDDETDVLELVRAEIMSAAPHCALETATTFDQARKLLAAWTYDLLILDIMGVRGFDLLEQASVRDHPIPVVMLTAHAFSPESMQKSIELGARAYLPKERLGAIVPFLEDVLNYEYGYSWKRVLKDIEGIFREQWGAYWRKPNEAFWAKFEAKISDR